MTSISDGVSVGRQVLRREVNDRLRASSQSGLDTLDIFCECGRRMCAARVRVAAAFYEDVIASGRLFLVTQGHENAATDAIVGSYDAFLVIDRGGV